MSMYIESNCMKELYTLKMVKWKLSVGGVCNDDDYDDDGNNDYNVLNLSHTEQKEIYVYIELHSDKGIEYGFDLL